MDSGVGQGPDTDPPDALIDDVRRELARLGTDARSAPEVPAEVTARVSAALRAAPPPGSHAVIRPKLTRLHRAGLLIGACAVAAAAVVGAITLTRDPAPVFPAGPTASQITVTDPAQPFPLSGPELLTALDAAPDLGPLTDAPRRASCLAGLGYAPTLEVLGGRQIDVAGRPGVLLLLPGASAGQIVAVAVSPTCSTAHTGLLAETLVNRR
ncbi:hypothetical protein JN086_29350 [Mycolicibacterium austroafricanum]|uniref:Anti-sigma-M factor RsmA n=1 Tax=Mycolicibacterium austroafricanum TaxID=39687 RepID=A0ABT8HQ63_MYCAO|nr:hypothetical protein [Mycolicibacterium austroafricanum]MDN4522650.1 hypothetical protein [Mycolicibacterium austroafricanum]QRZ06991.1 hypothetical protein JN090_29830 [Mycolicibacterium austroafricanum]QZT68477.1 hypothetical protein JN086_29350 [Mycolicibacterium austroafricanum]